MPNISYSLKGFPAGGNIYLVLFVKGAGFPTLLEFQIIEVLKAKHIFYM
jgi:hypothetical protein